MPAIKQKKKERETSTLGNYWVGCWDLLLINHKSIVISFHFPIFLWTFPVESPSTSPPTPWVNCSEWTNWWFSEKNEFTEYIFTFKYGFPLSKMLPLLVSYFPIPFLLDFLENISLSHGHLRFHFFYEVKAVLCLPVDAPCLRHRKTVSINCLSPFLAWEFFEWGYFSWAFTPIYLFIPINTKWLNHPEDQYIFEFDFWINQLLNKRCVPMSQLGFYFIICYK